MKRYYFIVLTLIMAFASLKKASAQEWTTENVRDIITNVNNAWQQSHPKQERAFWDPAVYHTGNMEAYSLFKVKAWRDYSFAWAEQNKWMGAKEADKKKWKYKKYGEGQDFVLFGDWQICFQTYLDLYFAAEGYDYSAPLKNKKNTYAAMKAKASPLMTLEMGPTDYYIQRALDVMGYEARSEASDYWWWVDALYMVMPVMTKMYRLTGDEIYLDKMYDNWKYCNSIMHDKETGLYFRDGKYVYPKHTTKNGKKDFWARGDGWAMAAFAKTLKDLPKNAAHRKEYISFYKRLADAIVDCQQTEGHWTRSILDPEQAPGYETSGTALNCYSLFWGMNNGILKGKKYAAAAQKAWDYLALVALQPDNSIGYVQPIGEKAIPGQVVNQKSVTNFGTGAFLLAACEYYRYLQKNGKSSKTKKTFRPHAFVGVGAGVQF